MTKMTKSELSQLIKENMGDLQAIIGHNNFSAVSSLANGWAALQLIIPQKQADDIPRIEKELRSLPTTHPLRGITFSIRAVVRVGPRP